MFIREIIVYIEDLFIGITWGNPANFSVIIMGSIMFSNSLVLKKNINFLLKDYNLIN